MRFFCEIIFCVTALASLTQGQEWIPWSVPQGAPPLQAPRGRENNFYPLYVIRANYSGDLIPGKFSVEYKKGYVSYIGKEIIIQQFEVRFASPSSTKLIKFFVVFSCSLQLTSNGFQPQTAISHLMLWSAESTKMELTFSSDEAGLKDR